MIRIFILTLCALTFGTPALFAKDYKLDKEKSYIRFSGEHAGMPFEGEFKTWQALIDFDENLLNQSNALITIDTSSAVTGNPMYDKTLPTQDWFNSDTYSTATFDIQNFEKQDDQYVANGTLTIKDMEKTLIVPFDLSGYEIKTITSDFTIQRLDYNLGIESDPNAEWVDNDIQIEVYFVTQE